MSIWRLVGGRDAPPPAFFLGFFLAGARRGLRAGASSSPSELYSSTSSPAW